MSESARISCTSRIDRVTLYARGAVVTRVVTLPDELPAAPCTLEVLAGKPLFDPRSLRASVEGGRSVLAIEARESVARSAIELGPVTQQIEHVRREIAALQERKARWSERQSGLSSVIPDPKLRPRAAELDPLLRVRDAIAVSALCESLVESAHREIESCESAERALQEELAALQLRLSQASSQHESADRPTSFFLQIAAREREADALRSLVIEYVVDAARWWPAYKVRLSEGAKVARWTLDAYVVQSSGEDWSDAVLSLSTADLIRDVRLPSLPSLRLGRAQPAKRAYRPAPKGLDELFAGFDHAQLPTAAPVSAPAMPEPARLLAPPPPQAPRAYSASAAPIAKMDVDDVLALEDGEAADGIEELHASEAAPSDMPTSVGYAAPRGAVEQLKKSAPIAGPAAAPMMMASVGAPAPQARGGGGAARQASAPKQSFARESAEIDPDEQWLDYDGLFMTDGTQARSHRGRLQPASSDRHAAARAQVRDAVNSRGNPTGTVDPLLARGLFDHTYEGALRVDVRADGAVHRVAVLQGEGHSRPKFRVVAKEAQEVYREAEVQNPFEAPLLLGPAEVFVDDALIARSAVSPCDRGGTIALGLGLEERIRVARNAKVHESSAGLLGGSTQIDHTVSIELSSSMGEAVVVEVIDRVPTARKGDEVEASLQSSRPKAQPYTQDERGAHIEGGLKWAVELAPGAKSAIEFAYRITLSSKLEVEGGNRRD